MIISSNFIFISANSSAAFAPSFAMDEKEKRSLPGPSLILLALALVDESRDDNIERQRKQWATYVIIYPHRTSNFNTAVVAGMNQHPRIMKQVISHDSGLARIVDDPAFLPNLVAMAETNKEVTEAIISHDGKDRVVFLSSMLCQSSMSCK